MAKHRKPNSSLEDAVNPSQAHANATEDEIKSSTTQPDYGRIPLNHSDAATTGVHNRNLGTAPSTSQPYDNFSEGTFCTIRLVSFKIRLQELHPPSLKLLASNTAWLHFYLGY
jgi:hypothetical protein